MAFVAFGILSRKTQLKYNVSPLSITFYFCVMTTLISLPFSLSEIANNPVKISELTAFHIFSIFFIGVISTSIAFYSYQKLLKADSPLAGPVVTYFQPLATVFLGIILLSEKITLGFIVGGILSITGGQLSSTSNGAFMSSIGFANRFSKVPQIFSSISRNVLALGKSH